MRCPVLTLAPLEPRDALSGTVTDYPRERYETASARFAAFDLAGERPDAIVLPAAQVGEPGDWRALCLVPLAADPATPAADLARAREAVVSIPLADQVLMRDAGVRGVVYTGPGIASLPQNASLRGVPASQTPGEYRTFDVVSSATSPAGVSTVSDADPAWVTRHELGIGYYYRVLTDAARAAWGAFWSRVRGRYPEPFTQSSEVEAFAEEKRAAWELAPGLVPGARAMLAG